MRPGLTMSLIFSLRGRYLWSGALVAVGLYINVFAKMNRKPSSGTSNNVRWALGKCLPESCGNQPAQSWWFHPIPFTVQKNNDLIQGSFEVYQSCLLFTHVSPAGQMRIHLTYLLWHDFHWWYQSYFTSCWTTALQTASSVQCGGTSKNNRAKRDCCSEDLPPLHASLFPKNFPWEPTLWGKQTILHVPFLQTPYVHLSFLCTFQICVQILLLTFENKVISIL
jgi:hypothetical protein